MSDADHNHVQKVLRVAVSFSVELPANVDPNEFSLHTSQLNKKLDSSNRFTRSVN